MKYIEFADFKSLVFFGIAEKGYSFALVYEKYELIVYALRPLGIV